MYRNAVISGTGRSLPEYTVKNEAFSKILDTDDEWISSRTGIKTRHIEQERRTHEMALEASKNAIGAAGLSGGDIDAVIGCTVSNDYAFPSLACLVLGGIGSSRAFAYDINAACAGFIYALDLADMYIKAGRAKHVLIVTADIMTRYLDFGDRRNCILFGDGAGAAVVSLEESEEQRGVLSSYLMSDSSGEKPYFVRSEVFAPAVIFEPDGDVFRGNIKHRENYYLEMNGREVFQFAVKALPQALEAVLASGGYAMDDLNLIVAHQANKRILEYVIEKYSLDPAKLPINIADYANMSTTTITVLLDELCRGGRIKKGDLVATVGFGSGLVFGSNLIRF